MHEYNILWNTTLTEGPPAEATIKEIDLDFGQQIGEQIWIAADDTTMIDRVCLHDCHLPHSENCKAEALRSRLILASTGGNNHPILVLPLGKYGS